MQRPQRTNALGPSWRRLQAGFSDEDKEQMKKHWKKVVKEDYTARGLQTHLLKVGTRVEVVAVHIERSQQLMNIVYNEWRQKKQEALRRELELLNTTGDAEQQLDIVNIEQQQVAE